MMVLSRIWYAVCAIVAALCFYALSLAVGQFNRSLEDASKEELKADVQVISVTLQIDARRRLDALLVASADEPTRKALKAAQKEGGWAAARVEAKKALDGSIARIPEELRPDIAFAVDREGRVLGHLNYPAADSSPEFELGGYAAVFDSLRGYLRDDTWVLGGTVYRVNVRPIEDEIGQPPLGALVALKTVNTRFVEQIGKSRASLVFFLNDNKLGQTTAQDDDLTSHLFDVAAARGAELTATDFNEAGRSEVLSLSSSKSDLANAVFVRMPGEAGALGLTYGVLRQQDTHGGLMDFITRATDTDKAQVKIWVLALLVLGLSLVGVLLTVLEHGRPLKAFRRQATLLREGKQDSFQLPQLAADFRRIGTDVNQAIERIAESRGGQATKKPADLQSILGPAQQGMSAFSLPGAGGSGPASAPGSVPQASAPISAPPVAAKGGFAPPAPKGKPPPPKAAKLAPPAPKLVIPSADQLDELTDGEATRVGSVPPPVMAVAAGDDMGEWRSVYEDFVRTKQECGESVEGLSFEKFQNTLRKNRDSLMQRQGTKSVKFSVYVKEGKAALKATPLKG